jgi:adenine-specific DNA-methyltransferase
LWITVDDNEAHYLKVLCDEVFGRRNFVTNAIWQKKYTVANDAKWLSESHDHVLVYALNKETWRPYRLGRSAEMDARYRNPDNHPKGPWKATPLYAKRTGSEKEQAFSFEFKNGFVWTAPRGSSPRFPAARLKDMDKNDEIWFGADGQANPSRKTFLCDMKADGPPSPTVWLHSDVGNNHEAREEVKAINQKDPFATPKPERLIKRILDLATSPGDLVLDSFLGSGTTAAVAHKMGRRWIGIELGEHCETHCLPRLKKVVDGEDPGGITAAVGWKGGGGFRYYRLAPSLLEKDKWGNWVVSKEYNAAMLAEAVCKLEGFSYEPSDSLYWQHGQQHRAGFHLHHHREPESRPAPGTQRRSRPRAQPARRLLRLPWPEGRLPEPHREKDPQRRPHPLRVGQGRLQPEGGESPQSPAGAWAAGAFLS